MAEAFLKWGGPKAMTRFPSPTTHIYPIHIRHFQFMRASDPRFLVLVSASFNCDTETKTKNRGSKVHINWTCGQGNCVAKVYYFSNPNSCCKYHNRPYILYLSVTIKYGLKYRAPPSNWTPPVMPLQGKMLKMTGRPHKDLSFDFPHWTFDYLSAIVLR